MVAGSGFVLGLDLGGTKLAVATAYPDGTLIRRQVLPTEAAHGAAQALTRAIEAGRRLVEETGAQTGGAPLAVGIATMGLTCDDGVLLAPNVPGWEELRLPSLLRAAFPGLALQIANDVKAATLAEVRWGALAGSDTALYINLGTGIAAGLVVGGRVVEGAHGAAGEIAYNLRSPHEEVGARQHRTPLEEYAGGRGIGARASILFERPCTTQEVFARAHARGRGRDDDDGEARTFVEATLDEICFHVTNLAIALDPERVALGGGMMASGDVIVPRLAAHVHRFVPFPPVIVHAHFRHDAGLMGAIALAVTAQDRP